MPSRKELNILKEMLRIYEDALYQIKDIEDIEEAKAIAFVAINHDFEE